MTIPEDRLVALSQLRSGDLPPAEAAALRAEIDVDPELAAAWRRLGALEAQLAALPNPSPPAALRGRVVRRRRRSPMTAALGGLAALAAAAAIALIAPGAPPATLTLLEGHQDVVGAVDVLVPGGAVSVDGHARVRVEPRRAVARKGEAEDPMKSHLLSAAGGAVVTVAVLRGTAVLTTSDDAPPIEVPAGTTRVVQVGAPDAPAPPPRPAQVADRALDPAVAQYVADLEAQVAALTLQNTFVSGQLAQYQGEARPFPDDAHPWVSPDGFKEHVTAALASVEGLNVRDVDCDEYPCIAIAQSTGTEDELRHLMEGVSAAMKAAPEGEGDLNTMISADMSKNDDDPAAEATLTLGVALLDATNPDGDDLGPRIQQRLRDAQEALSDPR
jgi:hypothetical protein